jgi:hypothetical protein
MSSTDVECDICPGTRCVAVVSAQVLRARDHEPGTYRAAWEEAMDAMPGSIVPHR